MKTYVTYGRYLLMLVPLSASAFNHIINNGKVENFSSVSGPGKSVVQYPDGTAIYYINGKNVKATTRLKSSGVLCEDWNQQQKDEVLVLKGEVLSGKSKLITHMGAVLDDYDLSLDKHTFDNISKYCRKHPQKSIVNAIMHNIECDAQ